jgi:hypothetical protein
MKTIAVISKHDHAKGLARALLAPPYRSNYKATILGSNPSSIPSAYDIIVVRPKSCSHHATNLALKEQREGDRPVIFENGSERVLEALQLLQEGKNPTPAPSNREVTEEPEEQSEPLQETERPKTLREGTPHYSSGWP